MILKNINSILLTLLLFCAILHYGKFLLLPLSLALFIFIIIKSLSKKFSEYFLGSIKIKINDFISFIIILCLLTGILYFFWKILNLNLKSVIIKSDNYQNNLVQLVDFFSNLELNRFIKPPEILDTINFVNIFSKTINYATEFAGNFSLILIYIIFFMIEEKFIIEKINFFFKKKSSKNVLQKINNDIFRYFQIKTFTSFLTGIVTFFILFFFQSDLAPTFAVFSFFLNFIPFIGSLLSIIIPTIFSSVQFFSIIEPFLIFIFLASSQILIGNFLETKLMGKTLNISPLVMILFLSIMGKIWGVAGMFLSVPILVFLLIIFSNFQSTKNLAIFISEKSKF